MVDELKVALLRKQISGEVRFDESARGQSHVRMPFGCAPFRGYRMANLVDSEPNLAFLCTVWMS